MFYANGQIGDGDVGDIKSGMWTTVPYGWLFCDGSNYDTTKYAKLYSVLGSNKLPDLRECVLVGAGQSDNDYDANDNPTGIQAHDVYTVGQFKDDQLQEHTHEYSAASYGYKADNGISGNNEGTTLSNNSAIRGVSTVGNAWCGGARKGTTTHGKQMGVNYCIKAL